MKTALKTVMKLIVNLCLDSKQYISISNLIILYFTHTDGGIPVIWCVLSGVASYQSHILFWQYHAPISCTMHLNTRRPKIKERKITPFILNDR